MPAKERPSAVQLALYPIRPNQDGKLTHPLLWSDLPENLPELTDEEAASLTWDQVVSPTGPEFDRKKLMEILVLKNNPGRTPKHVTFNPEVSTKPPAGEDPAELCASDSEPPVSDSEDDFSDSESDDLIFEPTSDEEDYGQELDSFHKLSLEEDTPKVSKIKFYKAQTFYPTDQERRKLSYCYKAEREPLKYGQLPEFTDHLITMVAISTHLQLAFAWVTAINQQNITQLRALSSADFTSVVRPASLGLGPTNKEDFLVRFAGAPIANFNISLPAAADIVESRDAVYFYTTANGQTTHGFPWKNEYTFTITYSGDLIKSVTEFADPTLVTEALGNEAIVSQANLNC
ncbi:hypothetical protein DXG01_009162 [Tephrocybe rancida]|nr:hypothetical protein DXG01_009162 [Tephrocybe rancida]